MFQSRRKLPYHTPSLFAHHIIHIKLDGKPCYRHKLCGMCVMCLCLSYSLSIYASIYTQYTTHIHVYMVSTIASSVIIKQHEIKSSTREK